MKQFFSKITSVPLALALAVVALHTALPTQAHAQISASEKTIEGTWTVTVSPTPNGVQFPPLLALVTFAAGSQPGHGTVTETEDDAFAPTGLLSPGHGVWERVGFQKFSYTFLLHGYDSSGNLAALETDNAQVTLDKSGDTPTGRAHFFINDPNGNLLFAGDALLSAVRVKLQKLP